MLVLEYISPCCIYSIDCQFVACIVQILLSDKTLAFSVKAGLTGVLCAVSPRNLRTDRTTARGQSDPDRKASVFVILIISIPF